MIYIQMPGMWVEQERIMPHTATKIISIVADYYNLTVEELMSKKRTRNIVLPRNIAYWLIRKYTKEYLSEIGRIFGGRDHTVVLMGIKQVTNFIEIYPDVKNQVDDLNRKIKFRYNKKAVI